MPRRKAIEHPDDKDIDLAPPSTRDQLAALAALGYRGPTPSTHPQAATLLRLLREEAPPLGEQRKR